MLLPRILSFALVLAPTFAKPATYGRNILQSRDGVEVTEDDVDRFSLYSEYARSAYCNVNQPVGQTVTCEVNCPRLNEDGAIIMGTFYGPKTDVAGYLAVVKSRNQIVLVFRPTASDANWSTNCNYTTIPSDLVDGGMIHGGFEYAWSEISNSVLETVKKAVQDNPGFRVISIGHSLGGALAAVAAANLRVLGYDVDIYSYGAPRIGDEIFSDFITEQEGSSTYRITHNNDPVPLLPLAEGEIFGGQYGYRHISPEFWLTGDPTDPAQWPVDDVEVCEGGLNKDCNSGTLSIWSFLYVGQHGEYLGPMDCRNDSPPGFVNGVYIPQPIKEEIAYVLSGNEEPAPDGILDCLAPHS